MNNLKNAGDHETDYGVAGKQYRSVENEDK